MAPIVHGADCCSLSHVHWATQEALCPPVCMEQTGGLQRHIPHASAGASAWTQIRDVWHGGRPGSVLNQISIHWIEFQAVRR